LDDQISWKMSRNDNTRINFGCKTHGFKLTGSRFANCLNGMPLLERDLERPKCEDINECQLGVDACQMGEICENTEGSYRCVNETLRSNAQTVDAQLMEILRYENMKLRTSYIISTTLAGTLGLVLLASVTWYMYKNLLDRNLNG